MSRLIDADDFYKPFEEGKKTLEAIGSVLPEELLDAVLKIYDEIKERLDATPAVDAVGVVRCRDCKHRYIENMTWHCPFGLMGGEDFFCGYGSLGRAEMRSDEQ